MISTDTQNGTEFLGDTQVQIASSLLAEHLAAPLDPNKSLRVST